MTERQIKALYPAQATSDGAGVRLRRAIATPQLDHLDPFLMLDIFDTEEAQDYIAGFPPHPHRGFETVTYMLEGKMRHEDSTGAEGILGPGGVQWMTAGRGVIHSEMPEQVAGAMRGFQLWVNLPAKDKMTAPRYQNLEADAFETVAPAEGVTVKVIAGRFQGVQGPIRSEAVDPLYLDIGLAAGAELTVALPTGHNAFAFAYEGGAQIGGKAFKAPELAVLSDGDSVTVTGADQSKPSRLILVAGKPLNEPIARYGPFVMNTMEEIQQAFEDYRNGTLA